MLKRIAVFGATAFGAAVFLATAGLTRLGIPAETWPYVWPGVLALVLLIVAVVALVLGARWLTVPLWIAFVAQTIGALVFLAGKWESPWDSVWWTLGTVGVGIALSGLIWLIVFLRARMLERGMVDGFGDVEGVDPDTVATIRKNMSEALALLRRAGHGRNAVYELPWFLVVGRPAAGKTEAIKRSGLGLPVRKDWVKGVGGTHTSDFFFTNDMIFVDTPGAWVQEGATESLKRYWKTLTKLLRKFRGRRPLDGLIVVVPADDVMTEGRKDLTDQAANIREIVDLLHEELSFRFPVYVVVSKADLIQGFTEFFWGVPAQRRDEILGWSNPDPNDIDVPGLIERGLARLQHHIENYRVEMLSKLGRRTRNLKLFFFSEEMRQIRQPLTAFTDELLHEDPSTQTPIFRGFYFTSAMQGEGAPVSRAMAELARQLGLPTGRETASKGGEESRAFFLKELLRVLMVGDGGLVARTRFHWLKQRRLTGLGTFLPAGVAGLFLILSFVSLMWNRSIYSRIESDVPRIVERIEQRRGEPLNYESLSARLAATDELRRFHRTLTSFNPLRSLGMRRSEGLAAQVYAIYKSQFSRAVLEPTLELAQRLISGDSPYCADRVEVLHSVIWLRTASRFESSTDVQPLVDATWDVSSQAERDRLSKMFRDQFGYLKDQAPYGSGDSLLAGFNLRQAATDLRQDCSHLGRENSLTLFATFQEQCLKATYTWDVLSYCNDTLGRIRTWSSQQGSRYAAKFVDLKEKLNEVQAERGAVEAYEVLKDIDVSSETTTKCVQQFDEQILPRLQGCLPDESVVSACRTAVRAGEKSATGAANEWYDNATVSAARDELTKGIEAFNADGTCGKTLRADLGIDALNVEAKNFGYQYLLEACRRDREQAPAPAPVQGERRRVVAPPPKPAVSEVFARTCVPGRDLTADGWNLQARAWKRQWEDAQSGRALSAAQKDQAQQEVRAEIGRFGSGFRDGWQKCLGGLAWHSDERTNDPARWLATLAESKELAATLSRPRTEADAILGAAAEEPFSGARPQIDAARQELAPLADAVVAYQAHLRTVSEDLAACAGSDERFIAFQQGVQAGSMNNSLVQLDQWLRQNSGLAGGRIRELLAAPYQLARGYVGESNVAEAYWSRIREDWGAGIAGSFPFVPGAPKVVPLEALAKMFGGEQGLVNRVPKGITLGPHAAAWLTRARELSAALYTGGDKLSPLRVTVSKPAEPERMNDVPEKFRLDRLTLRLGPETCEWKVDLASGSDKLELSDWLDEGEAGIEAGVAEMKGLAGRTLGSDWKKPERVAVKSIEGLGAPLRLLESLMPADEIAPDTLVPVVVDVPWTWKGVQQPAFRMEYKVKGPQLAPLVSLLRKGMGPPPAFDE